MPLLFTHKLQPQMCCKVLEINFILSWECEREREKGHMSSLDSRAESQEMLQRRKALSLLYIVQSHKRIYTGGNNHNNLHIESAFL